MPLDQWHNLWLLVDYCWFLQWWCGDVEAKHNNHHQTSRGTLPCLVLSCLSMLLMPTGGSGGVMTLKKAHNYTCRIFRTDVLYQSRTERFFYSCSFLFLSLSPYWYYSICQRLVCVCLSVWWSTIKAVGPVGLLLRSIESTKVSLLSSSYCFLSCSRALVVQQRRSSAFMRLCHHPRWPSHKKKRGGGIKSCKEDDHSARRQLGHAAVHHFCIKYQHLMIDLLSIIFSNWPSPAPLRTHIDCCYMILVSFQQLSFLWKRNTVRARDTRRQKDEGLQ